MFSARAKRSLKMRVTVQWTAQTPFSEGRQHSRVRTQPAHAFLDHGPAHVRLRVPLALALAHGHLHAALRLDLREASLQLGLLQQERSRMQEPCQMSNSIESTSKVHDAVTVFYSVDCQFILYDRRCFSYVLSFLLKFQALVSDRERHQLRFVVCRNMDSTIWIAILAREVRGAGAGYASVAPLSSRNSCSCLSKSATYSL